jgi:hypothetical protein
VADVNGDGYADIIQGDSGYARFVDGLPPSGEVRLWLGSRRGPRSVPLTITQDTVSVHGHDEPGDRFGGVVAAGDVDADGFADMLVSAVRENEGAGRVTVIRGGRAGFATVGNSSFGQGLPAVPGAARPDAEFGSSLTVLHLSGDRRPDVAVAAKGGATAQERIMVVRGGTGVFAPDETRTSTLPSVAGQVVARKGSRIRLARTAGG